MNSSLWLSILCYAVQICRLYRFGIFRCNSLYYNGIKAELVNIHFGFGIYNNKDSRLHISCSSGRKVGGCIGWTSEAFAWFFAAHSIAWTDHIPFDLCGKLVSAAEWKNEGVWFRFGSYNCWRQNNFQFWESSYLSSLLLGLTTPHSIHTPPQAVSVGVCPLLGVGAGPLWSCWPSRRSVRGGPWWNTGVVMDQWATARPAFLRLLIVFLL